MLIRLALILALGFLIAPAFAADDESAGIPPALRRRVDFETEVRPLLTTRCLACHGPDKQKGGLRLDRKSAALEGGDEGDDIIPGDGAESLVVRLTAGVEDDRRMPPKGARLSAEQVALLRTWIDQGADWPDDDPRGWWSLRPLARAEVPVYEPFTEAPAPRNLIDAFIRAKLREKGLEPSPEADRRALIRRLSFDLVGLPPSPEEIAAFEADADPMAYEKLVDRLLASPRYGERWARHWLDAAHYGDSHGYDKDKPRPHAWPYRDYVIRAFNADKPYGRFVAEQVAGDVLYPDDPDGVVALGFLASGPWDFVGHAEVPETKIDGRIARHLDRDDMVAVAINTTLGLTAQCAQCHDHKFDPISQEDYYRLQAVFAAVDRADRPYYPDPATARKARELTALRDQCASGSERERVEAELAALPPPSLVYAATIYDGGDAPFRGTGPDGGKPRPIHVLFRGDVRNPRKEVGPGALNVFAELPGEFDLAADAPEGERRAALARWLSDRRNPLVWRAIVNRVWQHHFGNGIVATPGDFGRMGEPPTHPELLDWLALNFRDGGQSIKDLHRLIVSSAAYRQSSAGNPEFEAIDAGDAFLWRAPRRKLEAEAVRDAALFVAGRLDPAMYGPAFQDFVIERPEHSPHYQYDQQPPDDPKINRRAIYRFLVRSKLQPFMTALDCADPSMRVDKRSETASPLQALALYNNGLMLAMSQHLAGRVAPAGDRRAQVAGAFALALGRAPAPEELSALDAHAAEFGVASACRVIFNLNEFLFID